MTEDPHCPSCSATPPHHVLWITTHHGDSTCDRRFECTGCGHKFTVTVPIRSAS